MYQACAKVKNSIDAKMGMQGSITVFASLCMGILIAVLCVIIQSTATHTAITIAEKNTIMSNKVLLSMYNREIFDNYHIFIMDGGYGTATFKENKLYEKIENNLKSNGAGGGDTVDLTGLQYDSIKNIDYTYITDMNGELFKDEIVRYMKYRVGGNFISKYMDRFKLFKGIGVVSKVMKKQQEVAKAGEAVSEDLLELMSCVDGIKVKKGGVVYDSQGDLEFEGEYLKLLVYDNSSMSCMGFENEDMFRYRSYKSYALKSRLASLKKFYEKWKKAIEQNDKSKQKLYKKKCKKYSDAIQENIDIAIEYSEKSVKLIDKILLEKKSYDEKREEYAEYLNDRKGELPDGLYDNFKDDFEENDNIGNLPVIRKCIEDNLVTLNKLKNSCNFKLNNNLEDIALSVKCVEDMTEEAPRYSVEKIIFNYSGLELEREDEGCAGELQEILKEGIIKLVIDDDKLKNNRYKETDYPSHNISEEAISSMSELSDVIVEEGIGEALNRVAAMFGDMSDSIEGIDDIVGSTADELIDEILVNQYIVENFNRMDTITVKEELQHELSYEIEYILFGNKTDKANAKAMVNKLTQIRTMCNFITILSDASKREAAYALSAAIFGFIPIPAVVEIAAYVIDLIWAYEEAMVDISALLEGGYVPVMKCGQQMKLGLQDLLILNRKLIKEKGATYAKTSQSIGEADYITYLELMLMLKKDEVKMYRCMDLIQANINNSYNVNMKFKNCIFGVHSEVQYNLHLKFADFRFVENMTGNSSLLHNYVSKAAFSY